MTSRMQIICASAFIIAILPLILSPWGSFNLFLPTSQQNYFRPSGIVEELLRLPDSSLYSPYAIADSVYPVISAGRNPIASVLISLTIWLLIGYILGRLTFRILAEKPVENLESRRPAIAAFLVVLFILHVLCSILIYQTYRQIEYRNIVEESY